MVCPPVAMARSKRGQLKKFLRNERDKHAVRFPAAMLQMRISQERPGNEMLSLMMRLRTARARRQTRIASGELRMGDLGSVVCGQQSRRAAHDNFDQESRVWQTRDANSPLPTRYSPLAIRHS